MDSTPKILIVDDEPRMCESLKYLFSEHQYEILTANSGKEALDLLAQGPFDIALVDMVMPDMNGHQLMDHINGRNPDTVVIIVTGNATLESAIGALRRGAYDFLRKPFEFDELLNTIQNALKQKRLTSENREINQKLALSESRYRYLVENSPDIIYTLDEKGCFTFISNAVERLLGFSSEALVGQHYTIIIHDEDIQKARHYFRERRTGERASTGVELRLKMNEKGERPRHFDLQQLTIELKSTGIYDRPTTDTDKKYLGTYGVARDISERKLLEAQLQHSQRMEAIGTLGGGIAHDFNNLLMGIQGNTSLILLGIDSGHPHYERLKNIEQQVQSGAELTRQLLGFARGGKYQVHSIDLNKLVKDSSDMFGRTKKEVTIQKKLQNDLWLVAADQGQIDQVLLNLYVNAWQAMPAGGIIYLETKNVVLNEEDVRPFRLSPGRYVHLSLADTGVGMDEATKHRLFEPFFTTKEMGRGTGLGLASAYGIIKNHDGMITVESEKGQGTTFHIYLPASKAKIRPEKHSESTIVAGSEKILLVDDEEMVVKVGKEMIEVLGYDVIIAKSGHEAVSLFEKHKEEIDLVILDMIMPEISGGETFDRLKAIHPDVKVILASGYSMNGQAKEILDRGCDGFIQKPFNIKELSHKMQEILHP
jgi:PAS domain S-box-containing protein